MKKVFIRCVAMVLATVLLFSNITFAAYLGEVPEIYIYEPTAEAETIETLEIFDLPELFLYEYDLQERPVASTTQTVTLGSVQASLATYLYDESYTYVVLSLDEDPGIFGFAYHLDFAPSYWEVVSISLAPNSEARGLFMPTLPPVDGGLIPGRLTFAGFFDDWNDPVTTGVVATVLFRAIGESRNMDAFALGDLEIVDEDWNAASIGDGGDTFPALLDVVRIHRHIAGLVGLDRSSDFYAVADMDDDGFVCVYDFLTISQKLAGHDIYFGLYEYSLNLFPDDGKSAYAEIVGFSAAQDIVPFSTGFHTTPMIAAGANHTVALRNDGTVWAWGFNNAGQLGDGTTTFRNTPVQVQNISNVIAISAGGDHSLALRADGTVWAWGSNVRYQLGDGTTGRRLRPVRVLNISNANKIDAGTSHNLARLADGTVVEWGGGLSGVFCEEIWIPYVPIPQQVPGLNGVWDIGAGSQFHTAIMPGGVVWRWGLVFYGDGSSGGEIPVPTNDSRMIAVAVGFSHALAIRYPGAVVALGRNSYGQLGDGTNIGRSMFRTVPGLNNVTAISAGSQHSLALSTGNVWAWGMNNSGQLGDGTTTIRHTPVRVQNISDITAISGGERHSVAVRNDGTVFAWGTNWGGQLGDGTEINRLSPVQVVGLGGVGYLNLIVAPPEPAFPITITSTGNGTAVSNHTTAAAGTAITLTATPDAGYHFIRWEVVSGGITITTLTNPSFVMPNNPVEVRAVFGINIDLSVQQGSFYSVPIAVSGLPTRHRYFEIAYNPQHLTVVDLPQIQNLPIGGIVQTVSHDTATGRILLSYDGRNDGEFTGIITTIRFIATANGDTRVSIAEIAHYVFRMQSDPHWTRITSGSAHPIMRGTNATGTVTRIDELPRKLDFVGRTGTSQGLRIRASVLLDALSTNNSQIKIKYSGHLDVAGFSQIRVGTSNLHGETLWTEPTGHENVFSQTIFLTREHLERATSTGAGDITLGASPHDARLTITDIRIFEILPPSGATSTLQTLYDMQTDPGWHGILNAVIHPIFRGSSAPGGSASRHDGPPREVNFINRSGTSQGLRLRAQALLNALTTAESEIKIEYTGRLSVPGQSQIRIERSPQVVWRETTGAGNVFSQTVILTREQLEHAAGAGTGDITLGATPANAGLTITGVRISEVSASGLAQRISLAPMVELVGTDYVDMQVLPAMETVYHEPVATSESIQQMSEATFNLATGTGTGTGWTWVNQVLTVQNGANIIITGEVTNGRRIVANGTSTITIDDVSIVMPMPPAPAHSPIQLNPGANVTLNIRGENNLRGGTERAGINAPAGTTIRIYGNEGSKGMGRLTATGVFGGAGIGGNFAQAGGNITINSGEIVAINVNSPIQQPGDAAGIGGGAHGFAGGDITINGGTVTATGGNNRASGIGRGGNIFGTGFGGSVTINGGTVTATGGSGLVGQSGTGGSGIGGVGAVAAINGGTVIANGGMGSGSGIAGDTLTISGGDITATSTVAGLAITANVVFEPTTLRHQHRTNVANRVHGDAPWVSSDNQPFVNTGFRFVQIQENAIASGEIDYVFVLDRSGSMSGQPIADLRVAAANLADGILSHNSEARIAVVIYGTNASMLVDHFSQDAIFIRSRINTIIALGGTNMHAGLVMAETLFNAHSGDRQRVLVHFSDGLPNTGESTVNGPFTRNQYQYYRHANAAYNQAVRLHNMGITKYSVILYGRVAANQLAFAQNFMRRLASDEYRYAGFRDTQDMAPTMAIVLDSLTGAIPNSLQVLTIGCPVHVTVTHPNGSSITSDMALPRAVTASQWGRITFSGANMDVKTVHLYEDLPFNVELRGYGTGVMSFSIDYFDAHSNILERHSVRNISITNNTVITLNTDNSSGNIVLTQTQPTSTVISVPRLFSTAPSPYTPLDFDINTQNLNWSPGAGGRFNNIMIREAGGFTGTARVRVNRYNNAGIQLFTEMRTVNINNGTGMFGDVNTLANLRNPGERVEITLFDESEIRDLRRLVVAFAVFDFNVAQ